jgi:hypothetical protein
MKNNFEAWEVNIEEGRPGVMLAKSNLIYALARAKRQGVRVVRLIHGYGSSGPGGAIRKTCHQYLEAQQKKGAVLAYIPGEEWNIFHPKGREALDLIPHLAQDKDLGRDNRGITIIILP